MWLERSPVFSVPDNRSASWPGRYFMDCVATGGRGASRLDRQDSGTPFCFADPTVRPRWCVRGVEGGAVDEAAFSSYESARRTPLFRTACVLCGDQHLA